VNRLIARGYVRKYQDAANRRRVLVTLRPEGKRLLHKLTAKAQGRTRALIERLSREEREELRRALLRLASLMEA
jgi:DNA-binding MarR family transcriptional regulator